MRAHGDPHPPPARAARSPHAGVGPQLAGDEAGRDGLSAAELSRAVAVDRPAGARPGAGGDEGAFPHPAPSLAGAAVAGGHQHVRVARLHDAGGQGVIERALGHPRLHHADLSAVIGAWLFSNRLSARAWMGVAAAALGVALLLWHELVGMAGKPGYMALALLAAATWALGTQLLRRSTMPVPTLAISFWMTALAAVVITGLATLFERPQWKMPGTVTWGSVLYNAILIFGFAHAAWFSLARGLPPIASTLSVMLIPVLGVFSGAVWLGEVLH